jgi:hypothetical protein
VARKEPDIDLSGDPAKLPLRLMRSEVCALARISPERLRRKIRAGTMPKPVDRGREDLFDRDAVLEALGRKTDEAQDGGPVLAALEKIYRGND